ncbi:MAG: [protein-PII] uridylyltransferase [Pirellulaceae bacterium]
MPASSLRPAVLAARERLAEGRAKLRKQHDEGSPGIQVCARLTDLVDTVLLDLYEAALSDLGDAEELQSKMALVPHGGYGRRDVAPFSDVDLMLLHAPGAEDRLKPLAQRLTQDLVDAGMQLGFAFRTPSEACTLAMRDATIYTSLAESRFLGGSVSLFTRFMARFRKDARRRAPRLIADVEHARREERAKFGETVYLLCPNIKRTRGGLRDIQLVRWIGFALHGESDLDALSRAGALAKEDFHKLRQARDFLLRLRNELHFHTGKASDIFSKEEQIRLAEVYGYQGSDGVLPVEQFMRDYFAHTSEVRYVTSNFIAGVRPGNSVVGLLAPIFSHQVEGDFRVGPMHISATRRGLVKLRGDLAQVLRLMDLANLYDKRIDHATWQAIRESMMSRSSLELTSQAAHRFLSLLSQPAQLGELLRRLHQLRVLEKLVPAMAHARCLLQFNEYHKYTVDEHSIRAVQIAAGFQQDDGVLGEVYRSIKDKRILHLAILLHDLGKGFAEDHSDVGERLAGETAAHLGLLERDAEILKFLVHKHLVMSHLAQWRDIDDDSVVVQFAVDVGSPEVLKMLFILTCADLAAVGPGVLNEWKLSLLIRLFRRAMRHLAGDGAGQDFDETLSNRRCELLDLAVAADDQNWWRRQAASFPASYLLDRPPQANADDLRRLSRLDKQDAVAQGRYLPSRSAVEYTIGAYETIAPGIFHRLCGALSGRGNQILWADIQSLADGLVLDRFCVHDLDYQGEPPAERLEEVSRALVGALKDPDGKPPTFRRLWGDEKPSVPETGRLPTRVLIDNNTADVYTIIDIFAHDRIGLLYAITRKIFELGLSVHVSRIGTHLDQVVDVFYVTELSGRKIADESRLEEIRQSLLAAIERVESGAAAGVS